MVYLTWHYGVRAVQSQGQTGENQRLEETGQARGSLERTNSKLVCSIFKFIYSFNQQQLWPLYYTPGTGPGFQDVGHTEQM